MSSGIQTSFLLDPEACTHCEDCVSACSANAIEITEDDIHIDSQECDGCEECALVCPTTAIQVSPASFARRADTVTFGEAVEPKEQARILSVPWTAGDLLVALGILLALAVGQRALRLPLLLQQSVPGSMHVLLTVWAVFFYGVMLLTLLLVAKRRGASLSDFGVRRFNVSRGVGYALASLLVLTVFRYVYGILAAGAGLEEPPNMQFQILRQFGMGPVGFVLAFLVAVVLASAAEELFFRGFVYTALRERMGLTTAIVLSSLIFALYHGNLWLIIPIMFLGMALAWLYETQQSLGPPLFFHALYNFLGIILIYVYKG